MSSFGNGTLSRDLTSFMHGPHKENYKLSCIVSDAVLRIDLLPLRHLCHRWVRQYSHTTRRSTASWCMSQADRQSIRIDHMHCFYRLQCHVYLFHVFLLNNEQAEPHKFTMNDMALVEPDGTYNYCFPLWEEYDMKYTKFWAQWSLTHFISK